MLSCKRLTLWFACPVLSTAPAGTTTTESEVKKGYKLPRACMTNADVTRLINSDEVQSVVNAPKAPANAKHYALKKNPLKNPGAMIKLNPQAASARRCAVGWASL